MEQSALNTLGEHNIEPDNRIADNISLQLWANFMARNLNSSLKILEIQMVCHQIALRSNYLNGYKCMQANMSHPSHREDKLFDPQIGKIRTIL